MTDYCLFTIEHQDAKRVYIRGIADITEPIDDYDKIVQFRHGSELKSEIPSNPYNKSEPEYKLYEDLVKCVKRNFELICDELVFAKTKEDEKQYDNRHWDGNYIVEFEKVII